MSVNQYNKKVCLVHEWCRYNRKCNKCDISFRSYISYMTQYLNFIIFSKKNDFDDLEMYNWL